MYRLQIKHHSSRANAATCEPHSHYVLEISVHDELKKEITTAPNESWEFHFNCIEVQIWQFRHSRILVSYELMDPSPSFIAKATFRGQSWFHCSKRPKRGHNQLPISARTKP